MKKHTWALALSLLGLSTQAHAGTWSISLEPDNAWIRGFDGEDSGSEQFNLYDPLEGYFNYWNGGLHWTDSGTFGFPAVANGLGDGTASRPYGVRAIGKLKAVYQPFGNEAQGELPKSLHLRFYAWIDDITVGNDTAGMHLTKNIPVGNFTLPLTQNQHTDDYGYLVRRWHADWDVKKLTALSTSGGQWQSNGQYVVEYPFNLDHSHYVTGNDEPVVGTQGDFTPILDDRAIQLSRGVGNDAYGKPLEYFAYEGGVPVTYGDTVYSHRYIAGTLPNRISSTPEIRDSYNSQGFSSSYLGSWTMAGNAPDTTWNRVPDSGKYQVGFFGTQQMSLSGKISTFGGLYFNEITSKWQGTARAQAEAVFNYSAEDNGDHVTANARYVLSLHEPVDNITNFVTGMTATTGYADANGDAVVATVTGTVFSASMAQSTGWSASGSPSDILSFLKPLNLEFSYSQSKQTGSQKSTPPATVAPSMEVQLLLNCYYNRHHSYFDKWNSSGKVRRMAYGPGSTTPNVEVQHEGLCDEFVSSEPG